MTLCAYRFCLPFMRRVCGRQCASVAFSCLQSRLVPVAEHTASASEALTVVGPSFARTCTLAVAVAALLIANKACCARSELYTYTLALDLFLLFSQHNFQVLAEDLSCQLALITRARMLVSHPAFCACTRVRRAFTMQHWC